MRQKLREVKEQISLRDTIRTLKSQIEYILWYLRNTNSSAVNNDNSGGTSEFSVEIVENLPPIPEEGYKMVYWTSAEDGNGDDQTWEAFAGQDRWYPCQKPTSHNGTPG